ncbi:LysR substrate-binding domain-containing protein [Paraburkholderia sp. BR13439]|uniref:LysR substrate-binding domain-containing protein n=1 Tax=Paraburkholderia sp. BR13439 TaxID=3236996 RepID=UPI0034CF8458
MLLSRRRVAKYIGVRSRLLGYDAVMDLNNLYYFAVVVEKLSFTAAAEQIGIPKGTLSKRIRSLEQTLGVRLANRTTRHFSLTEAGAEFHRHCVNVLVQVRAAETAIRERLDAPVGRVRIACTTGLVHMALAELAPKLQALHPGIDLELLASNRYVDLVREGFDFALRNHHGPLRDSSLVARRVADVRTVLVARPGFFPDGLPTDPAQLDGAAGVELTPCGQARTWELYGPGGQRFDVAYRPRVRCNDALMARSSALAGTGVAALPIPLCHADLRDGRLVRVLPDWRLLSATLSVALPSRLGATPAVRTAVDFLMSELPEYLRD